MKSEFLAKLTAARSEAEYRLVTQQAPPEVWQDEDIWSAVTDEANQSWQTEKQLLETAIRLAIVAETVPPGGQLEDPGATAKKILSDPRYRDSGVPGERNWLSASFERLGNAIKDWLERMFRPRIDPGAGGAGILATGVLETVVWGLLLLGLLVFVTFAILKFRLAQRTMKNRLALLDESEPDYTADEWMTRAAELEQQGRMREAVRCLYLASLTRLDEAGQLKFIRAETNWEHLARFEANPTRSQDIELRVATREFDRVWYGYRVRGGEDVAWFRSFYQNVLQAIGARR